MKREGKLLSFCFAARNDHYMGNSTYRFRLAIDSLAAALEKWNLLNKTEIVICDWGSKTSFSQDKKFKIGDLARNITRFVTVPRPLAVKLSQGSSFPEVLVRNTAIRRCQGEYIAFSNSDIYYSSEFIKILVCSLIFQKLVFWRNFFVYSSRKHIPYNFVIKEKSLPEIENYVRTKAKTFKFEPVGADLIGPYDFVLMPRKLWQKLRGFDEKLIFWGWLDIDLALRARRVATLFDLTKLGRPVFHLEHYPPNRPRRTKKKLNSMKLHNKLCPNGRDWGLFNYL